MARKPRGKPAQQDAADTDDETAGKSNGTAPAIGEEIEPSAVEMAAETLTGDLRDFILDRLRHEQNKRPWHERSESDQRDTVHQVEVAVAATIRRAVELIAGEGRRSIRATLEQVQIKDGIKATLIMSKFDEERHRLYDSQGAKVIIVADPEEFEGERAPVEIRPDQSEMLADKAAHGASSPFH